MAKDSKKAAAANSTPMLENGKVPSRRRNRKPLERRFAGAPGSPLPPPRQTNASRRRREYLTPDEIEKLLQASSKLGRHGARDRTLILLAYRHGLRVSELVALRWDQVDLKAGLLHVARLKNGIASTHPIRGPELRAGLDPLFWTPQCLQRRSQQWRTKERSIQRSFAGKWPNWSGRAANMGTCPGSLVQRIGRSENGSSKPSEMLSVAMAV